MHKNSLVFKITVSTSIVMIVLFAVIVTSNFYSLHVIRTNTVNSAMNEMKIHNRDINYSLNNALKDLNDAASNVNDISAFSNGNESERYFAAMRLSSILSERIGLSTITDALAVYNEEHDNLLLSNSSRVSALEKVAVSDLIRTLLAQREYALHDLWSAVWFKEEMFFVKGYNFSGTIIVSLVKADTLMSSVNIMEYNPDQLIVLTDMDGNPLFTAGNTGLSDISYPLPNGSQIVNKLNDKYLMISTDQEMSATRLSTIIKEKSVLLGLGYIQWIIAILGMIAIVVMPFIIYYLRKEIIIPIKALVVGTKRLEQGNLDYQVEGKGNSLEFHTLNQSFNSMVMEIKSLKISQYEEKIELQKAELKYLQMQIRPHFFLNALTTIHSLTYKDKNEDIRKFIDALSNHLRYMFKGGLNKVPVIEEIEYIKNFLFMQEIRFPNSVFHIFDVDSSVVQELIPQFIIHTFIENSFKHAMTLDEPLSIFIKINKIAFDGKDAIRIVIEDSGEGFPEEVLEKVNRSEAVGKMDGYRIGISNIKQTLFLLYGNNNLLRISNAESLGGRVEIIIPMEKEELL